MDGQLVEKCKLFRNHQNRVVEARDCVDRVPDVNLFYLPKGRRFGMRSKRFHKINIYIYLYIYILCIPVAAGSGAPSRALVGANYILTNIFI